MPTFRQADWYQTPLYYDIVFAPDTGHEADFLEAVWGRFGHGGRRRRALEPACGTGRLGVELAGRGWSVVGFDRSPAMVEFAGLRAIQTKTAARVQAREAGMEDFAFSGRFDLAFCLLSTFKYLLDEGAARAHLERVRDHLAEGGLYVLGLHFTDYARTRPEHERWVGERDGVRVVCNTRTFAPQRRARLEAMRNRLTVTRDGHTERLETCWDARTYSPSQFRALLRQVPGLETVAVFDFHHDPAREGSLADGSTEAVVVLRRAAARAGA